MDESLVTKYPELERSHFWWRTRRDLVVKLVAGLPFEFPTVLDVGCGSGVTAQILAESGSSVVGVDIDPEMPSMPGERFQYLCGDFLDLSADLGEFDVVLALDAVEHFEDERAVLRAMYTNVRPGGVAIVTVPAYDWLWSSHDTENHHFRRYTRNLLARAMSDVGFTIERVGYLFGGLLAPKAAVSLIEGDGSRAVTIADVPNSAINRVAGSYFRLETGIASRFRNFLPFGTSVVAVAGKPSKSDPASG